MGTQIYAGDSFKLNKEKLLQAGITYKGSDERLSEILNEIINENKKTFNLEINKYNASDFFKRDLGGQMIDLFEKYFGLNSKFWAVDMNEMYSTFRINIERIIENKNQIIAKYKEFDEYYMKEKDKKNFNKFLFFNTC